MTSIGWSDRCGLAIRTYGRAEAPGAYSFDRFFVEAQAKALGHLNVGCVAVGSNDRDQHHRALIFCLHGFVGELRLAGSRCKPGCHSRRCPRWIAAAGAAIPSPGPTPAPLPLPTPVPLPEPIPLPLPVPLESLITFRERVAPIIRVAGWAASAPEGREPSASSARRAFGSVTSPWAE